MMRGFRQVFDFTFKRTMSAKVFVTLTIVIGLIAFLLPSVLMPVIEKVNMNQAEKDAELRDISAVYYVTDSSSGLDFSSLASNGIPDYAATSFIPCESMEQALEKGKTDPFSLVLLFNETDEFVNIDTVIPDGSSLTDSDSHAFGYSLSNYIDYVILENFEVSPEDVDRTFNSVYVEYVETENKSEDDLLNDLQQNGVDDFVNHLVGYLCGYVNVMLVYFLVLYYGQGAANSVMMEKTSKLMDTFLVSVSPTSLIFGKLTAICLSAIIQFSIWCVALAGGFITGTFLVKLINPDSVMMIFEIFELLGYTNIGFSIPAILYAIVMVGLGFFMFCSLSSVGGALASKPEELSSTNSVFTLVLVASLFCCIYSGILSGNAPVGLNWTDILPFTAIMSTPARVISGQLSLGYGMISLGVVLLSAVFFVWAAGKIYRMTAFYKGNTLKPKDVIPFLFKKE